MCSCWRPVQARAAQVNHRSSPSFVLQPPTTAHPAPPPNSPWSRPRRTKFGNARTSDVSIKSWSWPPRGSHHAPDKTDHESARQDGDHSDRLAHYPARQGVRGRCHRQFCGAAGPADRRAGRRTGGRATRLVGKRDECAGQHTGESRRAQLHSGHGVTLRRDPNHRAVFGGCRLRRTVRVLGRNRRRELCTRAESAPIQLSPGRHVRKSPSPPLHDEIVCREA
jgi:hypothetical protein